MSYEQIIRHYEKCFEKYGDTPQGVDWPNAKDANTRHQVMLELILDNQNHASLLDFGCGSGQFLGYLTNTELVSRVDYTGLDLSEKYINFCRKKFPANTWIKCDVLKQDTSELGKFDYVIMNGVFTEKRELTFNQMLAYFEMLISSVFDLCSIGIAFNVMSSAVDWERKDLFHLPLDVLQQILTEKLTRNFVIRNDYGLYEYTVYMYKKSTA